MTNPLPVLMLGLAAAFGFAEPPAQPSAGTVHATAEKTEPAPVQPLSLIHKVTSPGPQPGARGLMASGAFTNGAWRVQFESQGSNSLYTLERSTDLLTWTPAVNAIAGPSESVSLADPNPPAMRSFYRVRARSLPLVAAAENRPVLSDASGKRALPQLLLAKQPAASSAALASSRPAFVQLKQASLTTSSQSVSTGNFNAPVTSGNLLLAWIWYNSSHQNVSSVTDSKGNSYAKAVGPTTGSLTSSGWRQELWYARNIIGGSPLSVTAYFNGFFTAQKSISAHEYSGLDTLSPLDATSSAVTSSANASAPPVAVSVPNELIFGAAIFQQTGSAGSGFTCRSSLNGDVSEDIVVATTGSYSATFSNTAQDAILQMVTFKAAGSGADSTQPTVPINLVAAAVSPSEIDLAWSPSTDNVAVAGYLIYRNGSQIATSSAASFSNTGLAPSTAHTYTVAAFDGAGNVSAQSFPASATTQALPVPVINSFGASPASITAGQKATLSWNASNAANLRLDHGIGDVTGITSLTVNPATTTTYTLTATNSGGTVAAQTTLTVNIGGPHTYTTAFPNTENPISENGNWINGRTVGLDWVDVRTTPGMVYSASSLTSTYADPTAVLAGTWGPTQTVSAVVKIGTVPSSGLAEVELRLRSSISAHRCTGYEFLYSLFGSYWQIVRWNGPLGDFTYIGDSGSGRALVTGDVLKATVTNNTFYFYLNGSLLGKATDSTFPSGSPGIGFYPNCSTLNWGFSSFTASDGGTSGGSGNSDTIRPSTPPGLSATAISSSQINLSWNASSDNVGVVGYAIYRGGTQIATSGSTTYSDTGLSPSTSYTYTVSAYDGAGNASALSTSASTITLAQTGRTWAHRQTGARNSSAASNALAFGAATQSGDLIIVEVDWSSASTFSSLSDSQGNVYTQIGAERSSAAIGVKSRLYYAKNIRGGANTITSVVSGSPSYHELYIHEYSGLSATNPLDAYSVNVGSGSSFTSGNLTTTAANELLYGIAIDSGAGSASAGWTTRSTFDSNVTADKNMPTVGAAAFTGGSAGAFIAWIAAYK